MRIDVRFPSAQSLKEKRSYLRPLVDGLRNRFEVSVAETDHADAWQRSELGVALVGAHVPTLENLAESIERFVWSQDVEVLAVDRRWSDAIEDH